MININTNGLLIDTDFLMNYKKHNLSGEEALFLLQINYLTEQGKKLFSVNSFSAALDMTENEVFDKLNILLRKEVIKLSKDNRIYFTIFSNEEYYSLKELLKLVERVSSKVMTSKEIDIVTSWFDKKYTKAEIDEALSISTNINYVNGILNNKSIKEQNINYESDDNLGYDWFGR